MVISLHNYNTVSKHHKIINQKTNLSDRRNTPYTKIHTYIILHQNYQLGSYQGFPGGISGKEPACQLRRCRFNPWVGKIPWRRKWQPTPVFLPGESHGQRSLVGYDPQGHKESGTTEVTQHTQHRAINSIKDKIPIEFLWIKCSEDERDSQSYSIP